MAKTLEDASDKLAEARKRNLDMAISSIQKEFGEAAIMRMGDGHRVDVDVIPTGNLLIDRALGVGGKLFVVVGVAPLQEALLVTRTGEDSWSSSGLFETCIDALDHAPRPEPFTF